MVERWAQRLLRGRHPISLPDAYLLATAKQTGSSVVSFDREVTRAATAEGMQVTAASSSD